MNQLVRRARAATREAVVASTLHSSPGLHRVLTFWPLLFYGLGVIVGAGIYVATGTVIERAGHAAPFSFLLAGVAAGLTGLCYAELGARFPEAAGGASYVRHGFGANWLTLITAAATTLAVAVSAASIAHGTIQYLGQVLPLPPQMLLAILIVGFTGIAAVGVRSSVGLAAAVGALEIGGLLVATLAGWLAAPELHFDGMIPTTAPAFGGAVAGAFIAFFAYVGFETLANMAEEIKDPGRTLPRGILAAIVASTILYIAVSSAVILSDRTGANPLIGRVEGRSASLFALVGSLSVANGVMVEIIMLARLFYGMGQKGQLPAALARVHPRTRNTADRDCARRRDRTCNCSPVPIPASVDHGECVDALCFRACGPCALARASRQFWFLRRFSCASLGAAGCRGGLCRPDCRRVPVLKCAFR